MGKLIALRRGSSRRHVGLFAEVRGVLRSARWPSASERIESFSRHLVAGISPGKFGTLTVVFNHKIDDAQLVS